jgi:hypothetical protein
LGNDPVRDLAEKVGATIMGAQGTLRTATDATTGAADNVTPMRRRQRGEKP